MKNIFVILISILVLNGCKPKSKSSLEFKTDTTTSSKGTNMPDVGDLKTTPLNTMSSGSSNWSMEYRDKFIRDCISKASEKVSNADATSYCNCMTEKVEVKYPNEKEVDARLTSADIESMRPGCAVTNPTQPNTSNSSGNWSAFDQKEFMDNCTPGASKTLGTGATDYCDCMLKKLMNEYPNSQDVGNVSQAHMKELATDCLKK